MTKKMIKRCYQILGEAKTATADLVVFDATLAWNVFGLLGLTTKQRRWNSSLKHVIIILSTQHLLFFLSKECVKGQFLLRVDDEIDILDIQNHFILYRPGRP